ncbi:response regulator [Alkalihalophilus sp. As8PL]|uniref:Response regulator n=1 Tax=Alkalihalophilus sp. As8PL TaxID=3237103 RepID=A0AB39BV85_9BACI
MIRAIVVDDEVLSLAFMEKKLKEVGGVEVVATFSDSSVVIESVSNVAFDVAFLDIDMGKVSGLDLAEQLMHHHKNVQIVFATAFKDYAIQAFELNSIDYLLKPVIKQRLLKTIQRLEQKIKPEAVSVMPDKKETLSITSFGGLVVSYGDHMIKWKTSKVKELFAFLLTHHDQYVDRDHILDQLWPEYDYKKAKVYLHTSISYLRQLLKGYGYVSVITFQANKYKLRLDQFQWDLLAFDQLDIATFKLTDDNVGQMEKVIEAYKGDYLEREGYDWAREKMILIQAKYIKLLEHLSDYFQQIHARDLYVCMVKRLLQQNPYSEKYVQQLMNYYIHVGERREAIKVYQDFKELLNEELGIMPAHSTRAVYHTIVN